MSAEISLIMLLFAIMLFPILFCLISDRYLHRQKNTFELKERSPERAEVSLRRGLVSQINSSKSSLRPERKITSAYAAHQYIEQHDMHYEQPR